MIKILKDVLEISIKVILMIIIFFMALLFIVSFPMIIENEYGKIVLVILLIPTIYVLFILRKKNINFYGRIEIAVGFATIISIIYNPTENVATGVNDILKLLGGIYVIIRGLDNVEKGLKSPQIIKNWEKIFFKIK